MLFKRLPHIKSGAGTNLINALEWTGRHWLKFGCRKRLLPKCKMVFMHFSQLYIVGPSGRAKKKKKKKIGSVLHLLRPKKLHHLSKWAGLFEWEGALCTNRVLSFILDCILPHPLLVSLLILSNAVNTTAFHL